MHAVLLEKDKTKIFSTFYFMLLNHKFWQGRYDKGLGDWVGNVRSKAYLLS